MRENAPAPAALDAEQRHELAKTARQKVKLDMNQRSDLYKLTT
jgi:hypothetical protein